MMERLKMTVNDSHDEPERENDKIKMSLLE